MEPVEVKKLLEVDSMGGQHANRERRCSKSLPNSLYNSVKDPSIVSSISMIEEKQNEVKANDQQQQPRLEVTNMMKKESKQVPPRVIPVVNIIPALSEATVLSNSPAKIKSAPSVEPPQNQRSKPASQPSPTTSKNVLDVPNGGTKAKKLKQPIADQQDNYGTMTLKVNPMYKRSASEVAKNSNIVVTCNTCFPLFKKLVK